MGFPLFIATDPSVPTRGQKKSGRSRFPFVPQVGTPACAVRSELLNLRFKMVAFRALQALPSRTRTPGNVVGNASYPIGSEN